MTLLFENRNNRSTLAQVMPELTRGQIAKANKKHGGKFFQSIEPLAFCKTKLKKLSTNPQDCGS